MLIRLTPKPPVASSMDMAITTKYETRDHAVTSYGHAYGRYLREMADVAEMHDFLRHRIDLADLPGALADKYAMSDRAWHRFLNDIIRYSCGGRL